MQTHTADRLHATLSTLDALRLSTGHSIAVLTDQRDTAHQRLCALQRTLAQAQVTIAKLRQSHRSSLVFCSSEDQCGYSVNLPQFSPYASLQQTPECANFGDACMHHADNTDVDYESYKSNNISYNLDNDSNSNSNIINNDSKYNNRRHNDRRHNIDASKMHLNGDADNPSHINHTQFINTDTISPHVLLQQLAEISAAAQRNWAEREQELELQIDVLLLRLEEAERWEDPDPPIEEHSELEDDSTGIPHNSEEPPTSDIPHALIEKSDVRVQIYIQGLLQRLRNLESVQLLHSIVMSSTTHSTPPRSSERPLRPEPNPLFLNKFTLNSPYPVARDTVEVPETPFSVRTELTERSENVPANDHVDTSSRLSLGAAIVLTQSDSSQQIAKQTDHSEKLPDNQKSIFIGPLTSLEHTMSEMKTVRLKYEKLLRIVANSAAEALKVTRDAAI